MTAQTSYEQNQQIAFAGMVFAQAPRDVVSRSVETGPVAFGVAVSRGTNKDSQAVAGGATGFLGIALRVLDMEGAANTGAVSYATSETVAILREGYVWAVCPTGCVAGDPVKYTDATGVLDSGAAAAGETAIDAYWDSSVAAGGLAVIRLNSNETTAGA